jgi:hypothetical protein
MPVAYGKLESNVSIEPDHDRNRKDPSGRGLMESRCQELQ